MAGNDTTVGHFKDWPNDKGFESEFTTAVPAELRVTGSIPTWACGTLYRVGPGKRSVVADNGKTISMDHWFDGFALVHRFQIISDPGLDGKVRVLYSSRFTVDSLLETIRRTGKYEMMCFGQKRDPCESYFQKLKSFFSATRPLATGDGKSYKNIGVTLSINLPGSESAFGPSGTSAPTLVAKTDASLMQQIDADTLEPIGIAQQSKLHPDLKGPVSSAHARSDPVTGDIFNFNLELSRTPTYRVFRVSAATGTTDILAAFPATPAYLHSFFLTSNYVVLCVWNSHFTRGGISILWNRNMVDSLKEVDPKEPATWYVVDRKQGGLLAAYTTPAFFAFHTVNAWEQTSAGAGEVDIVAEVTAYDNLDIVKHMYYDNVRSNSLTAHQTRKDDAKSTRPTLRRYRLPNIPNAPTKEPREGLLDHSARRDESMELPTINPSFLCKPHRYTYGILDRNRSTLADGLVKYDSTSQTSLVWDCFGHTPGEAIYLHRPDAVDEDDGVLLSVVYDGISGKSYLLCLDARTMAELGRAEIDGAVGLGFHGTFASTNGTVLPDV